MSPTRRTVVKAGVVAGSVTAATAAGVPLSSRRDRRASAATPPLAADPFTLSVASGDPLPDGFVIWTRLAPDPLAADGFGGVPPQTFQLEWEVALDPRFAQLARTGTALAGPDTAHAVHVDVRGLEPGREYWFRFRSDDWLSQVGRAVTAPPLGSLPDRLRIAQVSCAQYAEGYFTVYRRLAESHPDLVVHLGDYIYEFAPYAGSTRSYVGAECRDLATYRQRYAQYHLDPDLQAAHETSPFVTVFDDHEVSNNWAGLSPARPDAHFAERRAGAFKAFWENLPMRQPQRPVGYDMQLYRRLRWGRLANLHLLDTRQFRSDQACNDGYKACAEAGSPTRTMLGPAQQAWLGDGLRRSAARWDLLAQQVVLARRDANSGAAKVTSMDAWDGYERARFLMTQSWVEAGVRNPVVLTGDVHSAWANELKLTYDRPAASVGVELVTSSITSAGDGYDNAGTHPWMPWNPHLKFYNNLRGWIDLTLTPGSLTARYRVVSKVTTRNAPAWTKATYVVKDGDRTLRRTYLADRRALRTQQGEVRPAQTDVGAATIAEETRTAP